MRVSQYFAPTLREVPSEAELPSHQLLLRAGYIRKVSAGVYTYLPLAWRTIRKLEGILRSEMDQIGAGELHMPTLVPRELMEETQRWELDVVYKLQDRRRADFALGFTHEEVITDLARTTLRSWRDLPCVLYQIQTKFRDEPRPRGGLLRTREFLMYDAYSFDSDAAAMGLSYQRVKQAYERFFHRIGLPTLAVEADGGAIGDKENHEFMVLSESGEDAVLLCPATGYAANAERCAVPPPPQPVSRESEKPLEPVSTPGARSVSEVTAMLAASPEHLVKTLIYLADGEPVLFLVRGDRSLNELKAQRYLGVRDLLLADEATVQKITGAPVGFAGPVGILGCRIVADFEVAGMRNFITGANQADTHLVHVNHGRDFTVTQFADLRLAEAGDPSPDGGGPLETIRGIEVGHIFQLGTKYSQAMGALFTDTDGQLQPIQMGCYGIGVSRTLQALIEVHHDSDGIRWPVSVAPFTVVIVVTSPQDTAQKAAGETLYATLQAAGIEVALDDRDDRPGVKFKDADLVGYPVRVVIGKGLAQGQVELRLRRDPNSTRSVAVDEAPAAIQALLAELRAELS